MLQSSFDKLRAMAIGSQALGLTLIIALETALDDGVRFWQGVVLAAMLSAAVVIALMRTYRNKRRLKQLAQRQQEANENRER